jgi:hypothetical protein
MNLLRDNHGQYHRCGLPPYSASDKACFNRFSFFHEAESFCVPVETLYFMKNAVFWDVSE